MRMDYDGIKLWMMCNKYLDNKNDILGQKN